MKPNYKQGNRCDDDRFVQEERLGMKGHFSSYDSLHITDLMNTLPKKSIIVEVGVFKGLSTVLIHESLNMKKEYDYYCVDLFVGLHGLDPETDIIPTFLKNIEDHNIDITLYHEDSVLASNRFDDDSVGFVYIDANHEAAFVQKDVIFWREKVKVGGYLGGHDRSCVEAPVMQILNKDDRFERIIRPEYELDDCWFYKRVK